MDDKNEEVEAVREVVQLYEHYMNVAAPDLLAEYASSVVRQNRTPRRAAIIEEAYKSREHEMDDYMILVEERDS